MAQVDITINGRTYPVACADGEEAHLRELGQLVSEKVTELSSAVGQIGDSKLLLMAGLLIADELSEANRRNEALQTAALNDSQQPAPAAMDDDLLAEGLAAIAERIEGIAERLEHN